MGVAGKHSQILTLLFHPVYVVDLLADIGCFESVEFCLMSLEFSKVVVLLVVLEGLLSLEDYQATCFITQSQEMAGVVKAEGSDVVLF